MRRNEGITCDQQKVVFRHMSHGNYLCKPQKKRKKKCDEMNEMNENHEWEMGNGEMSPEMNKQREGGVKRNNP